jgi:hypothetical protein
VDNYLGRAKSRDGLVEQSLDISSDSYIRLHGEALAASPFDFRNDSLGWCRLARIVHHNGKSVFCQTLCDGTPDSTGSARDNCARSRTFHE